jgi:hypothetical protein
MPKDAFTLSDVCEATLTIVHTVYMGLREDKPADQVRRETARSE